MNCRIMIQPRLKQSEKITRQDEYARLSALHHPLLECRCTVLADVQMFRCGGVESDEQAIVKPDSDIHYAVPMYQELLVCPKEIVGTQIFGYLFQRLRIRISMPVFQIDCCAAVIRIEERCL